MKTHYLFPLLLTVLFSCGILAQDLKKYNPNGAYQKTLKLENTTSSGSAITQFSKNYNLDKDNTFVAKKEN